MHGRSYTRPWTCSESVLVVNRLELTPLDIAACFGDYLTFSAVKAKEASLAPVKEQRVKPRPSKKKAPPPIVSTVPGEAHSKKVTSQQ